MQLFGAQEKPMQSAAEVASFLQSCRVAFQASGERGGVVVRVVVQSPQSPNHVFSQALFVISSSKSVTWRGKALAASLEGAAVDESLVRKYRAIFKHPLKELVGVEAELDAEKKSGTGEPLETTALLKENAGVNGAKQTKRTNRISLAPREEKEKRVVAMFGAVDQTSTNGGLYTE